MTKKKFWSSEKIVSISAILISLLTFISIVYQNNLLQKHQSASVLPYLEIWNSQNTDRYELILMNNGIGPAFIKDIRVVYNDSTYKMDPYGFFANVIKPQDSTLEDVYYSNVIPGRLIPAGERFEMLGHEGTISTAKTLASWFAGGDKVRVEIEFESVYEERWLAAGIAQEPVPLN